MKQIRSKITDVMMSYTAESTPHKLILISSVSTLTAFGNIDMLTLSFSEKLFVI